ncbi:hypothetical protein CQA53_10965 [Helicobacter didelphidarum]|uniref:Uncharacterized protein n=1 Tax=Helicobacter didelphidarum TaxID=2040648 RepID=A0A3D8I5C9_9HELI|nr:hypothetical protein CQA53_10965 [Helicobacter didelphidarum]
MNEFGTYRIEFVIFPIIVSIIMFIYAVKQRGFLAFTLTDSYWKSFLLASFISPIIVYCVILILDNQLEYIIMWLFLCIIFSLLFSVIYSAICYMIFFILKKRFHISYNNKNVKKIYIINFIFISLICVLYLSIFQKNILLVFLYILSVC